jgi:bifunctional NMN adenylyltransferase/nudix hydrolase
MKIFDTTFFIGRFQPFHNVHRKIIVEASEFSKKIVIVLGSHNQPRTLKNPFLSHERKQMIENSLRERNDIDVEDCEIIFEYVEDSLYNDREWIANVTAIINKNKNSENNAIIGHEKDESSFYLKEFPFLTFKEMGKREILSSTDIRSLYFKEKMNINFLSGVVPESVLTFLKGFSQTPVFEQIIRERNYINEYKAIFSSLPYPPVFVTADAVVFCNNNVLMVQRKFEPGKGLLALPGGFLDAKTDKSVLDCMLRELKEETGVNISDSLIKESICFSKVFDAINRSERGRVITHAFKIELILNYLPLLNAGDDAETAKWVPVEDLNSNICFDDHLSIIKYFM